MKHFPGFRMSVLLSKLLIFFYVLYQRVLIVSGVLTAVKNYENSGLELI